jgi:hypothetical protein
MRVEGVLGRAAQRVRFAIAGVRARRVARERAGALLVASLDTGQRLELARERAFTVRAPSGRRYRIGFGTVANIEAVGEDGEPFYRLCAGPLALPTPAVMLAQKLMLETREAEFLAIARFTAIEEARRAEAPQRSAALVEANPG